MAENHPGTLILRAKTLMVKKLLVNLCEVEDASFMGQQGDQITGFRYKFVLENGEYLVLFHQDKKWEDKITNSSTFDRTKAFEIELTDRIFRNQVTWRLTR